MVASVGCTGLHGRPDPDTVQALVPHVAVSANGMVAASAREATDAGAEVLAAGGNAMDAAVATALALGVADPGDSGLGGTTYILARMADGRTTAIDGSTPVPCNIDRVELARLARAGATAGPQLAAVPASLAALDLGARRFGTMPLRELLAPAIAIAESGYVTTSFQRAAAGKYLDDVLATDLLRWIILRDGRELPDVGSRIVRPDLARTLRRIAKAGADEFYRGEIASEIEADMIRRGGYIRRRDLAMLKARIRRPVRGNYRGYEVLSFPPPGGGGALIEALNILEQFPPELLREDSADRLQVQAESFRLATEDYHRLNSDPNIPERFQNRSYLGTDFAAERAALITLGRPIPDEAVNPARDFPDLDGQTVQVSVVDRWGNAVSLTQTLNRFYGNKVITDGLGFVYNSSLETSDPESSTLLRPRSIIPTDMAPTIVLRDGKPLLVLGSAASSRIPGAVASVISNVIDRGLSVSEAVTAPRVLWSWGSTTGICIEEIPPITGAIADGFLARGFPLGRRVTLPTTIIDFALDGAVNVVYRDPDTGLLTGLGDPRRCGTARGVAGPALLAATGTTTTDAAPAAGGNPTTPPRSNN